MNNHIILSPKDIEKIEWKILQIWGFNFKESLNEFSTAIDRSLNYLREISLPIIMASKVKNSQREGEELDNEEEGSKSYNPFSEIIEKYAQHLLISKLERQGFKLLPIKFSSDLTFEYKDYIVCIDIKTANIDNPSDYEGKVPLGVNQFTHIARLPMYGKIYYDDLNLPFYVYPTLPPKIERETKTVLILTYAFLFIYPSYREELERILPIYNKLVAKFNKEVKKNIVNELKNLRYDEKVRSLFKKFNTKNVEELANKILDKKPPKVNKKRIELVVENIIRGILIHNNEELLKLFSNDTKDIILKFKEELDVFIKKIMEKDIKPIGIMAISIPNGLLKDKYKNCFVSGKQYGRSTRFYYIDRKTKNIIKFEYLDEKPPRFVFLDINKNYINTIKNKFGLKEIPLLDIEIRWK